MARQYLGCPASSASVERLFSAVGVAYADKRKSAGADTLESIMFAQANLPYFESSSKVSFYVCARGFSVRGACAARFFGVFKCLNVKQTESLSIKRLTNTRNFNV